MNKVILVGGLGKDPEMKYTSSGKAVCNFSIATDEFYNGEKKTEWHRIVAWGKTAELCGQYLSKGSKVGIDGKLTTRSWEQNGEKKYMTEVVAFNVEFLSPKQESNCGGPPPVDNDIVTDTVPF